MFFLFANICSNRMHSTSLHVDANYILWESLPSGFVRAVFIHNCDMRLMSKRINKYSDHVSNFLFMDPHSAKNNLT